MARVKATARRPGSGSQVLLLAVSLSAIPLIGWAFLVNWWSGPPEGGPLCCTPHRGTFVYEVVEQGSVECASNVEVTCEVNARGFYRTQILELVPEGTYVEPGDFLVKLDSAPLEELQLDQTIDCNTSEAALVRAENQLETCTASLREYLDGLLPQQKAALSDQLDRARETLRRAEQTLEFSQAMYRQGYLTRVAVEADEYAAQQAKVALETAKTKLRVLENYTSERRLKELEAGLAVAEASVQWRRHVHQLHLEELKNLEEQIAKCVITAPMSGQVVYAHLHHDTHSHLIEPGETVWENRSLIRLPNSTEMQVRVQIPESKVAQVQPGLFAKIHCQAFPDAELTGEVELVSEYPSPNDWWGSQIRSYETVISIDREAIDAHGIQLRPGLSAEVRILVDRREEQLLLPFQAVFRHGKKEYCILRDGHSLRAREIETDTTNGKFVVVRSGLVGNESVVLGAAHYRGEVELPELAGSPGASQD